MYTLYIAGAMGRTASCVGCHRDFIVATMTGSLPTRCETCDPAGAAKRRETSVRQNQRNAQRRDELARLRQRVDYLEGALAMGRLPRRDPTRPAGRDTVTIAVRRVGHAEGRRQTIERLRELAAEALAWADALGCIETTPTIRDMAKVA